MLADDCVDGQVTVLSESPLTTRLQLGSLQIDVEQELEPVTLGGSTLRQTYTLTNNGGSAISAHLVRHLDGDPELANVQDFTIYVDGLTENPKIYGTQRNSTLVVNYDPALDPGRHTVVVFGNVGRDASAAGWWFTAAKKPGSP